MTGAWVYGALIGLVLVHLVALRYMYRSGQTASGSTGSSDTSDSPEDAVECPECGAENVRGYRYCRECVSELPGAVSFLGEETTPQERRTL